MDKYYGEVGGANDPLRAGDPMAPLNMLKKCALPPLTLLLWFRGTTLGAGCERGRLMEAPALSGTKSIFPHCA